MSGNVKILGVKRSRPMPVRGVAGNPKKIVFGFFFSWKWISVDFGLLLVACTYYLLLYEKNLSNSYISSGGVGHILFFWSTVKCFLDNKEWVCVWGCIITLTEFPIDGSSTTLPCSGSFFVYCLFIISAVMFPTSSSPYFRFTAQQIQNCNLALKGSSWKVTK